MKLAYVAGPLRADSDWEKWQNIRRAEEVSRALWKMGIPNICPHKNSAFFSGNDIPEEAFMEGGLEIVHLGGVVPEKNLVMVEGEDGFTRAVDASGVTGECVLVVEDGKIVVREVGR